MVIITMIIVICSSVVFLNFIAIFSLFLIGRFYKVVLVNSGLF